MEAVMIRYGELFLKSDPVMRYFIRNLLRNTKRALESEGLTHRFEIHRGRILIHGDEPHRIAEITGRIFGIVEVAVCRMTGNSLDEISETAVDLASSRLQKGGTFAVRARRQGVKGITSQEIGARLGSAILDACPGVLVDLSCPQYEIFVEMREFGTLIYDTPIPAPGGLPWGTQGRVLSLLSSGIDSPVATWLMMKRGCDATSLHIDGGQYAGSDVLSTAERHLAVLSTWCAGFPMDLLVVDAESFYHALISRVQSRYRCVLCKRFMLGLGSEIAKNHRFEALITGDSLGQVASQTLTNLVTISDAATVPVLRPLIAFDKNEVVRIAKKIGTFESKQGDLSCRAVPRMPATAAKKEEIRKADQEIGMESLIAEAMERVRVRRAWNGRILDHEETCSI